MWGYNASASPTLNTTQMALSTLKDRCAKQQKKLDDLEREKLVLQMENETLAKSLHRLDEDNMVLRERNLEVSHELKQNSYEVVELRRHLSSQGVEEPMSLVVAEENPEDLLGEVLRVGEAMEDLKRNLLDQQNYVKKLIDSSNVTCPQSTTAQYCPPETLTSSQICPMCEVSFAPERMTQEEFVNHVNGHFSFEDDLEETLDNFEVVEDSSMS